MWSHGRERSNRRQRHGHPSQLLSARLLDTTHSSSVTAFFALETAALLDRHKTPEKHLLRSLLSLPVITIIICIKIIKKSKAVFAVLWHQLLSGCDIVFFTALNHICQVDSDAKSHLAAACVLAWCHGVSFCQSEYVILFGAKNNCFAFAFDVWLSAVMLSNEAVVFLFLGCLHADFLSVFQIQVACGLLMPISDTIWQTISALFFLALTFLANISLILLYFKVTIS